MEAFERAHSTTSSLGSRENSLAAPVGRRLSKGGVSSTATSVTGSDRSGDGDLHAFGDGASDRRKSRRGSEDAHSETSSRRKMSKLFKVGRRRRKSMQDDVSPGDTGANVPPLPDMPTIIPYADDARFQSEESLGLHKSVPSSLLTDDSDAES